MDTPRIYPTTLDYLHTLHAADDGSFEHELEAAALELAAADDRLRSAHRLLTHDCTVDEIAAAEATLAAQGTTYIDALDHLDRTAHIVLAHRYATRLRADLGCD